MFLQGKSMKIHEVLTMTTLPLQRLSQKHHFFFNREDAKSQICLPAGKDLKINRYFLRLCDFAVIFYLLRHPPGGEADQNLNKLKKGTEPFLKLQLSLFPFLRGFLCRNEFGPARENLVEKIGI